MFKLALAAKIAGFSGISSGSHYLMVKKVMEELDSRGHEVVMVISSDYQHSRSSETIPHKVYEVPYKAGFFEEFIVKAAMEKSVLHAGIEINELQRVKCECLLNSTELLQDLRNFDLIVHDGLALCTVLVADLLGIHRVAIIPGLHTSALTVSYLKMPLPVSYSPIRLTGFTDKMSFMQRAINVVVYVISQVVYDSLIEISMVPLKAKYNITPEISYREAFGKAELVIFSADFALEYPQPLLPGQIMVGPISVNKPNPLPAELENFINNSGGHGFIIVSFGSYVETVMSKEKIDVLAAAFGKLKQKVIWKLKHYIPPSLKPNIKLVEWLPQNDLLGHKDIRAFVSHVGQYSLYESAYHGVPVVAVPLFADQFSNAKRAEHFGLGMAVNHKIQDAQQLLEIIESVVNDPRFKREAMRISKLMKDKPRSPLEETGDWIEYVLRHGGARHLRPQVFNIPWYQYYLLDIMTFLVAIVTFPVIVIRLTCRCLYNLCCEKSGNKTKED